MKNSSVIVAVVIVILVGVFYLNIHERMARMEERVQAAERALETLEPIQRMMAGLRPGISVERPYEAKQATGRPDVEVEGRDDPRAWCPARSDSGEEWIQLAYSEPVEAVAVRVVASCHPGAVQEVVLVADDGSETVAWSGQPSGEGARVRTDLAFPAPRSVKCVKVILNTAAVPGWNQIDAVALLDGDGNETWAAEATASSHWSAAELRR